MAKMTSIRTKYFFRNQKNDADDKAGRNENQKKHAADSPRRADGIRTEKES